MARLCRLLGLTFVASVASQYAPTAGPTVEAAKPTAKPTTAEATPLPTAELTPGPTAGPTPRPTIELEIHNSAGRGSELQLKCTPEAGGTVTEGCVEKKGLVDVNFAYDASEASLGAVLAFAAYGDYRVKGGTILDSFDSQCWRDHWQEEWGRPVGELSQYYFKGEGLSGEGNAIFAGGDNLAYVAHLSNGTRGDTLVISFRGMAGCEL